MKLNTRRFIAFSFSLAVHLLVLIYLNYFLLFRPGNLSMSNSDSQKVTLYLNPKAVSLPSSYKKPVVKKDDSSKVSKVSVSNNKDQALIKNEKPQATVQPVEQLPSEDGVSDSIEMQEEAKQIDERAIYDFNQGQETNPGEPVLELHGWIWDSKPVPKDDTNESGRIVFEIKIDSNGEVLAVRTLEKTISGVLESVYRESLEQLTFSKISNDYKYAPVYTGKVTFIIKEK
jgi:protein TonB